MTARDSLLYERLYRRAEASKWSAMGVDFSTDVGHWDSHLDERQRRAALWNYSMCLNGVDGVGRALTAVINASPGPAQTNLLAMQLADEARNRVFLDRFLREVAGQGHDAASTYKATERHLSWAFKQVFDELDRVADALRKKPREQPLLAQTVALCHIVIEGVLAIPGGQFLHRYAERRKILPGLSWGLGRIAQDEARHVEFGTAFLSELVGATKECRSATVETWNRVLPWIVGVFVPPQLDLSYLECFDITLTEVYAFGLRSLEMKMAGVGIDPSELYLLSLDDRSLSYEERARRILILVESNIIGDERAEPRPSPEALEILFEGTARAVDREVARSLGGAIEWTFTDAEPWHLVIAGDHAEAKLGRAGDPALQLEIAAGDWAKVAVGRGDARWALVTRKLKVHGSWQAKAKLARLFR